MKKARGRGWPRSSHLRRCTGRCSRRRRWLRFSPTRGSEDGHRISLTLDHVMRELWGGATLKSAHGNELCRSPLMRSTQPPHCLLRKRLGNEACEIDTSSSVGQPHILGRQSIIYDIWAAISPAAEHNQKVGEGWSFLNASLAPATKLLNHRMLDSSDDLRVSSTL